MVRFKLERQVSTPEYTLGVLTEQQTGFKCKTLEKAVYDREGAFNPMFYAVQAGEYPMKIVDIGNRFTFGFRFSGTYRNARMEGKATQKDIFPGSIAVGKKFVERKGLEGGEEVQNVLANLIDHLIATGDINPRTAANDISINIVQDEMVTEQGQEMEDPNAWKPKNWNMLEDDVAEPNEFMDKFDEWLEENEMEDEDD